MQYREIEGKDIELSLLGFGCMRFPTDQNGKIERTEAQAMIDYAYKQGINYYDTAYPYHGGESEEFIGEALKKRDRSSFYLATKLPMWEIKSLEDAKKIFNQQLKNLQTDYIDFYLLHSMTKDTWDKALELGIVSYWEQLKKDGKIHSFGFSFHDAYEVFEEMLSYRDWDFCQIQLNYMDKEHQAGLKGYELAKKSGIPVFVMEPVKGGSLAEVPDSVQEIFDRVNKDLTPPAWALRWVASHPGVKLILSGMSSMKQVKENIATFSQDMQLSDAELTAIDQAGEAFNRLLKNACTGCRYCMPCPSGVDIPKCFFLWNELAKYGNETRARNEYFLRNPESIQAKNCVECGACEEACPQNISIIEDLKRLTEDMEPLRPKE